LVVGGFAKTLRVLRLRAANSPTMNWKIAILVDWLPKHGIYCCCTL